MTIRYAIVEKKNHLAIHGLFDSMDRAEQHLKHTIPIYIAKSYFMDKTLRANDFEIKAYGTSTGVN